MYDMWLLLCLNKHMNVGVHILAAAIMLDAEMSMDRIRIGC